MNVARQVLICSVIGIFPALSAPDFSAVEALLGESVADGTVAGGSVLLIHKGEVVFERGFGFANVKLQKPFEVDTPVVVASISKPLLGTAMFKLAEKGKLDLLAPISKYLPAFAKSVLETGEPLERAPTTVELFTHTSGLRDDESPGGRPWYRSWVRDQPLETVVDRFAKEFRFKAQPGSRYAYSGIGTDVAARVLEVAAGEPRNVVFLNEVAKPLGMERSCFRDAAGLERIGVMPTRYYRGGDGKLLPAKKRRVPESGTYSASGGTIISTAPDLARWLLMISNGGKHEGEVFLPADVVAEMIKKNSRGKNAHGGMFVRKSDREGRPVVFGHTGSSGTNCWIDVEKDLIGIVLTQTRGKDIRPFRIELEKRMRDVF